MHETKISRLKRESNELYEPKSGKGDICWKTKGSKQKRTAPTFSGEDRRVPLQAEPRCVPIGPEPRAPDQRQEHRERNQEPARRQVEAVKSNSQATEKPARRRKKHRCGSLARWDRRHRPLLPPPGKEREEDDD